MAHRSLRAKKRTDYAKLNKVGLHGDELEDGQIIDSPLRGDESDDETVNSSSKTSIKTHTVMEDDDTDTLLDYEDDFPADSVSEQQVLGAEGGGEDLASDDVWERQQRKLQEEREQRELLKRRLQRQKDLAQAKFIAEQEKETLKQMERDIMEINQRRSVNTSNKSRTNDNRHLDIEAEWQLNPNGGNTQFNHDNHGHVHDLHVNFPRRAVRRSVNAKTHRVNKGHSRSRSNERRNKKKQISVNDKVNMWLDSTADENESEFEFRIANQSRLQNLRQHEEDAHMHKHDKVKHDEQSMYEQNDCNINCFSRKAIREQRKAVTGAPPATVTSRDVRPKEKSADRKKKTVKMEEREKVDERAGGRGVYPINDDDSDGESIVTHFSSETKNVLNRSEWSIENKRMNVKSGFLEKPRSKVMFRHKWPHMNQDPRYVTQFLMFDELNFPQFVGGECRTILWTSDQSEITGRLRVLSKIAYLFNQCGSWDRARATYFAIVGSIEEGEATWSDSFNNFDLMCLATNDSSSKSDNRGQYVQRNVRNQTKRDFFCRDFQKGECSQVAPHKSWIRSNNEWVEHFCAACFRAKLGKLSHIPGSNDQCMKK